MDSSFIGILLFFLGAAAIITVYILVYGSRRALQQRYAQTTLELRQGATAPDSLAIENTEKTDTAAMDGRAHTPTQQSSRRCENCP
jgi:hypothetical protein